MQLAALAVLTASWVTVVPGPRRRQAIVATGIRTQFFEQSIHLTLLSSTSSLPLSSYKKGYLSAILGNVSLVIRINRRLTPSSIPDSIFLLLNMIK